MNKNPDLYVITHCESCYNQRHIFTGRLNSHLTKSGIKHAFEMSEQLKSVHFDLAIRTSLERTKETLDIILQYHPDCKIEIQDSLLERDYGQLSGKNKDKYARDYPDLYPLYHRSYHVAPPGGESMVEVEKRVVPFIELLTQRIKKDNLTVLIVAHANSLRPIIRYFEKLTTDEMMNLEYLRHRIFRYQIK